MHRHIRAEFHHAAALAHIVPPRSFLPDSLERYVGFRTYLYAATMLMGDRPMPEQARKTGVGEARQGRSPAGEKHAFDLGERWLGPANKLDYLIRRHVIPDHPCDSDRAFARAAPFRSSAPSPSWEFARMHGAATRGNSVVNEVQAAIGRCLSAEYDLVISEPIPDRLMTLLRTVCQEVRHDTPRPRQWGSEKPE